MPLVITPTMLAGYLGPPPFTSETAERIDEYGIAIGLAWTPVGGEILFVEATRMQGKGGLILTGSLGEVMKESAQTALSFLRNRAASLSIDLSDYDKRDIHIHVPAGATPKDGPSAGLTIVAALASLLTAAQGPFRPGHDGRNQFARPRPARRRHQGKSAGGGPFRFEASHPAGPESQRLAGSAGGSAAEIEGPFRGEHRPDVSHRDTATVPWPPIPSPHGVGRGLGRGALVFVVLSKCAAICLMAALPALANQSPPDDLAAGQALAEQIRNAPLEESNMVQGTLSIHAGGQTKSVPVVFRTVIHDATWETIYDVAATTNSGPEQLTVIHHTNDPNEYLYARASTPSAPLPKPAPLTPAEAAATALAGRISQRRIWGWIFCIGRNSAG
jgi:hypothetical protein